MKETTLFKHYPYYIDIIPVGSHIRGTSIDNKEDYLFVVDHCAVVTSGTHFLDPYTLTKNIKTYISDIDTNFQSNGFLFKSSKFIPAIYRGNKMFMIPEGFYSKGKSFTKKQFWIDAHVIHNEHLLSSLDFYQKKTAREIKEVLASGEDIYSGLCVDFGILTGKINKENISQNMKLDIKNVITMTNIKSDIALFCDKELP